jgi:hypothetical protein
MLIAGAKNIKTKGTIEKRPRRLVWFDRKRLLKKNQPDIKRKMVITMYAMEELK